ncbi:MAG: glutamate-1-semialdehyde 2,1-aminomutase [Verrucomicrobia bacterium]|nr:glutamate-1-semialdehyde 2,1-aminomutase [Verrucomicrobiota bacterium]
MERSKNLFQRAKELMPGGVNSPVRAFRAVGGTPFFTVRAEGARLFTVDEEALLDYVGTWGPAILGHAHPKVIEAVQAAAAQGTSFGTPCPSEVRMAELVVEAFPSIEKVRMCNSGTEACMSAIRLARGFTGRPKIVKFAGCYHGHADHLLVKAGSGALTFGHPDSAGVPEEFARHTLVLPYNETGPLEEVFAREGEHIAAVILEPVTGNAGVFLPRPGWLQFLREITRRHDALLIFDEVMTGFRLGPAGAQGRFGVTPDLTCLGKIIGGGLPVGAFGGRAEIMDRLAPEGPVYQAGTLSGNPAAMAAGIAEIEELQARNPYAKLEKATERLRTGLEQAARAAGLPARVNACCSMFSLFFTEEEVWNLDDAMRTRRELFPKFFHAMLRRRIYFAPSPFEAGFISLAHTEADIDRTVEAAAEAFKEIAG